MAPRHRIRIRKRRSNLGYWLGVSCSALALIGVTIGVILIVSKRWQSNALPGWSEFSSVEGGFRVMLPKPPEVKKRSMPGPDGVGLIADTACLADNSEISVGVMFADLDTPTLSTLSMDRYINAGRDAIARNPGWKVASEEESTLDGRPARLLSFDTPQGPVYFRYCPVDRRLYIVSLFSITRPATDAEIRGFFESFHFTQ
jgi:hypothetical protein